MGLLRVAPEFLVSTLFQGAANHVHINDATFDQASGCVMLDISGLDVPDGEILAICTKSNFSVRFEPAQGFGLRTAHPQEGPKT